MPKTARKSRTTAIAGRLIVDDRVCENESWGPEKIERNTTGGGRVKKAGNGVHPVPGALVTESDSDEEGEN